jgi:hypothetical protein
VDERLRRLRGCFQPRQWFNSEGEPDPDVVKEEDVFMWVYRTKDGKYQVGYFMPDATWFCESEHETSALASARVNYLNGGKQS